MPEGGTTKKRAATMPAIISHVLKTFFCRTVLPVRSQRLSRGSRKLTYNIYNAEAVVGKIGAGASQLKPFEEPEEALVDIDEERLMLSGSR